MNLNFYCDESGNTGTDWLNFDQPYFVYGGWLVKNDNEKIIRSELVKLTSKNQSIDIKSKNVLKRPYGLTLFDNVFDCMIKNEAVPFFIISDKRYMLAAKITETFFDPAYNKSLKDSITFPNELKKSLAMLIAENTDILSRFALLIKSGTINLQEFKKITNSLISLFNAKGHNNVAKTLKVFDEENLLEMINEFEIISDNGLHKNRLTLTIPILSMLLQLIEVFVDKINGVVQVFHDDIRGYDEPLEQLKNIILSNKKPEIFYGESGFIMTNYPHIKTLQLVKSQDEILIQMADLLCGFVNRVFLRINQKESITDIEKDFLRELLVLHDDYGTWDNCAPNSFIQRFAEVVFDRKFQEDDYNAKIKSEFKHALR